MSMDPNIGKHTESFHSPFIPTVDGIIWLVGFVVKFGFWQYIPCSCAIVLSPLADLICEPNKSVANKYFQ